MGIQMPGEILSEQMCATFLTEENFTSTDVKQVYTYSSQYVYCNHHNQL